MCSSRLAIVEMVAESMAPLLRRSIITRVFENKGAASLELKSCSSQSFFPMICYWMIGMSLRPAKKGRKEYDGPNRETCSS